MPRFRASKNWLRTGYELAGIITVLEVQGESNGPIIDSWRLMTQSSSTNAVAEGSGLLATTRVSLTCTLSSVHDERRLHSTPIGGRRPWSGNEPVTSR